MVTQSFSMQSYTDKEDALAWAGEGVLTSVAGCKGR